MPVGTALDEGVERAAVLNKSSQAVRFIIAAIAGVVVSLTYGILPALCWIAVEGALQLWLTANLSWIRRGRRGLTSRLSHLGVVTVTSAAWSALAAALWFEGSPLLRIAAAGSFLGLLLEGVKLNISSPAAARLHFIAPALSLTAIALFSSGAHGWSIAAVLLLLAGMAMFVGDVARVVRANAVALRAAEARALDASQAKSAFLAMISHELRTPLNGVLGMAHALAGTELSDKQADYLDTILRSGDGLLTILNDILDISKIEAGKLELEVADFDLAKLADLACLLWSEAARQKGVDLVVERDAQTVFWRKGDPNRVRQVLLNLVSNALKFTEQGEVRISLGSTEAGHVILAVEDTGLGMTEEQQSRLFQDYAQADASTARRFGGTGLGLSICRQLVDMMGGEISCTSQIGQGSMFTAILPLPVADPALEDDAEAEGITLEGRSILVVDDNEVNLSVARAILEAVGAEISVASDGVEGLSLLGQHHFDAVLMDVNMPRMGGIEAVARIRAGEAGRSDIPIVALTADAMSGESDRLMGLGFDAVHPKPIQPAGLLAVVAILCTPAPAGPAITAEHDDAGSRQASSAR